MTKPAGQTDALALEKQCCFLAALHAAAGDTRQSAAYLWDVVVLVDRRLGHGGQSTHQS